MVYFTYESETLGIAGDATPDQITKQTWQTYHGLSEGDVVESYYYMNENGTERKVTYYEWLELAKQHIES